MTVKELFEKCKEKIDDGYGDSLIVLCTDEDNFCTLESGFSSPIYNNPSVYDFLEDNAIEENDVLILN